MKKLKIGTREKSLDNRIVQIIEVQLYSFVHHKISQLYCNNPNAKNTELSL